MLRMSAMLLYLLAGRRSALYDITRRIVTVPYRRFRTTYRFHLQASYSGNSLPTLRDKLLVTKRR